MLSNDLCPSCHRIAGKLISSKILDYHSALINRSSDYFDDSHDPDAYFRKCSGCDKFFSSTAQDIQTITDGYNDQFNDESRLEDDCDNSQAESSSNCGRVKSITIKDQGHLKVIDDQVTSDMNSFVGENDVIDGMEDCSQDWSSFSNYDELKIRNRSTFANWIHPTYFRDTLQKVPINEVILKIKNNFYIDKSLERPFICRVDHECQRSYKQKFTVENHLFSQFFFFNCPNCSSQFTYPSSLRSHSKICRQTPKSDLKLLRRKRSILDVSDSNHIIKRQNKTSKLSEDHSLSIHDDVSKQELFTAINILESLMHGTNESVETVPEQPENTIQRQSIISSYEILDTDEHLESPMLQSDRNLQSDREPKVPKLNRRSIDSSNVYRCPYCEYQCKPGNRSIILFHLNGRKMKGKLIAPSCSSRRVLAPADPQTGLYERLEPILVVESKETLIDSNESFNKLVEKTH